MILVVCTGNVCRSPFAERWLRHRLEEAGVVDVPVTSAGVDAATGRAMDPATVLIGQGLGLDCSGHVARPLTRDVLASAQLVLTAERAHRREVVQLHPPAVQRTFTVRQLGRLLGDGTDQSSLLAPASRDDLAEALRRVAVVRRGGASTAGNDDDDVIDPYGRPPEVHRRSCEQMTPALERIAGALLALSDGAGRTST